MAGYGTGYPIAWRCYECGTHFFPRLTGREKPTRRRGPRTSDVAREYECKRCLHVGWSKHVDLELLNKN